MSDTTSATTDTGVRETARHETGPHAAGRGLLHGTAWVVYRRHRTALLACVLISAAACAVFAYQRIGVMDFVHANGATPDAKGELSEEFRRTFGRTFSYGIGLLQGAPVLIGVFLGAPLIAAEREHGTLPLVTTQSVSRARWLATTLALPLAVTTVCVTALSVTFQWLWMPVHQLADFGDWLVGGPFDATGPVPVARTLFLTACGIALGMLLKRVVPAMAATVVLWYATDVLWSRLRPRLATPLSLTYPYNGDGPHLPPASARFDDWVATADGRLYGFGTCVHADEAACRAKLGIVNRVTQYFDFGQMAGMQWRGAGILLAATAVVLAFVVWQAHRRPL
ncbi:ABC transporter permease subunit [Streptomyces sp. CT34]|uniref:ABC transporter permease subunit n=1 Tax=Streptomyces sp. CT34 TaxID=1553907 RepID=UPI000AC86E00|nr:ABC transporter permease subunit [Streptomyces sp. CT34]